jgi:hypothetical protein
MDPHQNFYESATLAATVPSHNKKGYYHTPVYQLPEAVSLVPQSRQSAKLFLPSSELGLHQPLDRRAHSLAREGAGESQFRRGDIYCSTPYMCTLCLVPTSTASRVLASPVDWRPMTTHFPIRCISSATWHTCFTCNTPREKILEKMKQF